MLHALAQVPLFAPIADLLLQLPDEGLPEHATLDTLLARIRPGALSGAGQPLRFVPPARGTVGYEALVYREGRVPTRPDNWHDFFNALVWCAFPSSKAAMNARHLREAAAREAAGEPGRGPVRDALTHFDECGVIVSSCDPNLLELLQAHRWEEAFWNRRADLGRCVRFTVFGHATFDRLRAPHFGLCGKAIGRSVEPDWFLLPPQAQRSELDRWLAGHVADPAHFLGPREFSALPLLGIPGVTPESESAQYYRDTRQFRPKR